MGLVYVLYMYHKKNQPNVRKHASTIAVWLIWWPFPARWLIRWLCPWHPLRLEIFASDASWIFASFVFSAIATMSVTSRLIHFSLRIIGISSAWWFGDPRPPAIQTHPNPSFLQGPSVILRVANPQAVRICSRLQRIGCFQAVLATASSISADSVP